MIALYLVAGILSSSEQAATSTDRGDVGGGRRRRRERELEEFIKRVIIPIFNARKGQPKPGRKKQRAIAKQIIVAAGASDVLPLVPMFKDEIEQIGAIAVQAASLPNLAEAQAKYDAILRIIDEMKRQKAEQDELDELDIEELLLAA